MAFLAEYSVAIYKFDETYKQMDLIRMIDLGVHSTWTDLPFTDVFLMEKRIYLTDSSGLSQCLHLTTDETSTTVEIANKHGQCSRVMPFADKLAVGVVCLKDQDEDLFELSLKFSEHSRSCRLREVDDDVDAEEAETVADRTEYLRKLHWLYTFYHVFENFPSKDY
ncbi:hypothetical protein PsorP6_016903 [Peronosclerospora sorghi]|uniref:Uncharacterized protein n=1 Tax=Peronosclerospora sorghi TaxID=230839 RepID=A0ACC0WD62_9STRA|nr:hypothetical protein PsorP6_016903 [Peronosclerospora sorghi]